MINPPIPQAANPDEPMAIRQWTKTKLYEHLNDTYLLPAKESRGVTRSYLVGVYTDRVYRVERSTMLQFESRITLAEQKKSVFYNVSLLVERLDRLLDQLGQNQLGFPEGSIPEEQWFTRVLRFADQNNILGGFRLPIRDAPVPELFSARA
jgi:hypothetical protein